MHLPVEATAGIQVAVAETHLEIKMHEEVVTQEPTSSQLTAEVAEGGLQENDTITQ